MESFWMSEIKDAAKQIASSTQASQLDSEKLSGKHTEQEMILPWDIACAISAILFKKTWMLWTQEGWVSPHCGGKESLWAKFQFTRSNFLLGELPKLKGTFLGDCFYEMLTGLVINIIFWKFTLTFIFHLYPQICFCLT